MPKRAGSTTRKAAAPAASRRLTVPYKDHVIARLKSSVQFREALLGEAIAALVAGELNVGKSMMRDYINATMGFEKLARAVRIPPKSLMRMLGPSGNPQMSNIFAIIGALQQHAGVTLRIAAE